MRGKRQCKFGQQCGDLKKGFCRFLHSGSSGPPVSFNPTKPIYNAPYNGGMGNSMQTGPMNPLFNPHKGGKSQKAACDKGTECYHWKKGTCKFAHQSPYTGPTGPGKVGGGMGGGVGGGMGGSMGTNQTGGDFESLFCKNFHLGRCQNKKCPRMHKFAQDDSISRTIFFREAPVHFNSNVVCFKKDGMTFLPIKMGDTVYFLTYDPIQNKLENRNFSHKAEQEIMYFKCEQDNLLYAYEHPTTKLWTVCVYNIPNNLLLSIANAHQKFVTGIALIKDNTLITVSLDGKIKVWTFNTAKSEFEINTAVTQQLQSKMEGNQFTVCKVYEPLNTMVVGSKSGNVIMWNLSTMECAQTLIPTYTHIYDIQLKFLKALGIWMGFILAWSEQKQSAVLHMNTNTLEVQQVPTSDKEAICKMLITDELLLCGGVSGSVYIYRLMPNVTKIGVILYNNEILDLVALQTVTPTMITFKNFIVLEACRRQIKDNDDRTRGSVSIFRYE